jgi:hypothetical protein
VAAGNWAPPAVRLLWNNLVLDSEPVVPVVEEAAVAVDRWSNDQNGSPASGNGGCLPALTLTAGKRNTLSAMGLAMSLQTVAGLLSFLIKYLEAIAGGSESCRCWWRRIL